MVTGVIVLGGHVQAYGIVKVFGENKIPVVVIDTTKINISRHSKYCKKSYECSYEKLTELLLNFGKETKYKDWLIFPTDDYYVRILSINKNELNKYFKVTVDEWNVISLFFNKRNSYPIAESAGVPIPKTLYPKDIEELEVNSGNLSYPCIIKPAIMLDFYRYFKKKVFVCNNFGELLSNYKKSLIILKPEEILIQEVIPGNSENQYSVGIFYDRDKSYNYLVGRRKRQHPINFGNATTFAETVEIPELVEFAHKILSKANFWGLCEVEFKYDERDCKYKFLEVNPRTWKWHLISEVADIPFLMSIYKYLTEGNPVVKKNYKNSGWRDLVTDFIIIFKLIKAKDFTKSEQKRVVNAVANISDLKPFIYQLMLIPYLIIKR